MVDIPKVDLKYKERLCILLKKRGQDHLFEILTKVDAVYADKIHPNDKQRTQRALEVFFGTGKKFSDYLSRENVKNNINYIKIGLNLDRKILYERIDRRVDIMIENGLIDEVDRLLKMGYSKECCGLKGIGYKEIVLFFEKKFSLEEAIYEIKKNSRHYAKRQLTWFKQIEGTNWFDAGEEEIVLKIEKHIKNELLGLGIESSFNFR